MHGKHEVVPVNRSGQWRGIPYVGAITAGTTGCTILLCHWIEVRSGLGLFPIVFLWIAGFAILSLNVSYMLAATVAYRSSRTHVLAETVEPLGPCRTALVYVVKNERGSLLERMSASAAANREAILGIWLLSNSDEPACKKYETQAIAELGRQFPEMTVALFMSSNNPLGRKHVAIRQWLSEHPEYDYFVLCDADSGIPEGAVDRLLRKAEHPANQSIAVFQSHLAVDRCATRFVKWFRVAQNLAQRLYVSANQYVFDRAPFFGSGALIRSSVFARVDVPDWVLSHDIWDTVAVEKLGYRVAYCDDVTTYEDYPHDYCESLARDTRWIRGTLQSWRLLKTPGLSLGTRFFVVYPIYGYLCQPLLLLWIALGFLLDAAVIPSWVSHEPGLLFAGFANVEGGPILLGTMGILFFHRFSACRSVKECFALIGESFAASLLCLNSVFFNSLAVLRHVLRPDPSWRPTRKEGSSGPTLAAIVRVLWPTTLLGAVATILGIIHAPHWAALASPFLVSFCLGIPITYWSGRPLGTSLEDGYRGEELNLEAVSSISRNRPGVLT